jgi:midasin
MNHQQDETDLNDRLKFFWYALERICNAADFGSILKHGKKNQKKTALSSLFKTLEECGLSKHRPMGHEVLLIVKNSFFFFFYFRYSLFDC